MVPGGLSVLEVMDACVKKQQVAECKFYSVGPEWLVLVRRFSVHFEDEDEDEDEPQRHALHLITPWREADGD